MNNWALDNTFDKFSSSYFKSYDSTNNIALDISGNIILRNDMILYNNSSLNTTLSNLQSQYDLISISGLLYSIQYLNSVDTIYNYYIISLSGQINSIVNNLNTYGNITSLMNTVSNLDYYTLSLSGRINYNYYSQNAVNNYYSTFLNSLSGYVLSLSGRIKNYYYEQGAINNYYSTYLNSLSGYVNAYLISLSGRINDLY